jgi:RNA polymerase sigma factor (sigma-70 family)
VTFPPTRLSVVERIQSPDEATRHLASATLIDAYWKPVYKHLRLKWRLDPDEAADATQDFFAHALEKDVLGRFDPSRARFRTYLRLCLDGFAANRRKAERRLKRGGAVQIVSLDFSGAEGELRRVEPSTPAEVEDLFEREWVRALFDHAVAELRRRCEARERSVMFEVFARYDLIDPPDDRPSYAEIAAALGLTTTTVTNHLAAMRRQFREIVLDRLRDLTSSESEWEAEARRLLGGR